jgi:cobalt-zinc-cadmium efflux system outer membrane protein
VAVAFGCAPVKPEADYRRAAELVSQHTGASEVYDPKADGLVSEKVDGFVVDGLTVEEAITVALLNNRDFQARFADIGVSRAEVVQSGLLSNPEFSLMARFPEGGGRSDLEMGFAQQIVDLWQIPVRKKIAQAELEAVILDVARQAVDLAAEVRTAAYEVIMLRQAETTVRENLRLVQQSQEMARARFEAGMASQLDVNLARSDTINTQLELLQIQRERDLAQASLARLLSLSRPGKSFELRDKLPGVMTLPDTEAMLDLAVDQRVDAQAAEHRVLAAESKVRQEWLKIFPSVTAGLDFERMERRALPGRKILADTARESIAAGRLTAPTIESRAQRQLERRQEIDAILGPSFTVTLPIWDQNQAQIAKARCQAEQRRKEYESLLDTIANQIDQAAITLKSAAEIVEFYRNEALPQATQALDNARQLYQAGEQGIMVMIEAQESLVTRRQAYIRAMGTYAKALAELERALGGRLPEAAASSQPAMSQPTD